MGGAASPAGTLNGTTCTAEFDAATGTLTLWNYAGGNIEPGSGDLIVKLVGNNTITGDGMLLLSGVGNITITSNSNGRLDMNIADTSTFPLSGIHSEDDIIISGNAKVNVNANNTKGTSVQAIYANNNIKILDQADVNVMIKSK